jgi:hypothetical protein
MAGTIRSESIRSRLGLADRTLAELRDLQANWALDDLEIEAVANEIASMLFCTVCGHTEEYHRKRWYRLWRAIFFVHRRYVEPE